MDSGLIMPKEYYGDYTTKTKYVSSTPRKWTKDEIMWCKDKMDEGYSYGEIAEAIDRTQTSVSIKMKREKKKDDKYNINYRDKKYQINKDFVEYIKPKSILDVFTGTANYYNSIGLKNVITNDKDKNINADYHLDYLEFLCYMYYSKNKFDIVDLDPFGSAYDGFDLAIKMAKKGIIITFGEMGHKRFKRLDFVSRYYDINNLDDFNYDKLIDEVKKIGVRNKKELKVYRVMEQQSITRVWFTISDLKITSQWDK